MNPVIFPGLRSPVLNAPEITIPEEKKCIWVDFLREDAESAMDRDRRLFREFKESRADFLLLRFYRWEMPALSFGRTQGIDGAACADAISKGLKIVRRPTGGGKVFHGNDTCFSLIWRKGNPSIPWGIYDSYRAIHRWIQKSLVETGVHVSLYKNEDGSSFKKNPEMSGWCFRNPVQYDLVAGGRKMTGGAQWRDGGCALHQGSIQMNFSKGEINIFKNSFEILFNINFNFSSHT